MNFKDILIRLLLKAETSSDHISELVIMSAYMTMVRQGCYGGEIGIGEDSSSVMSNNWL